MDGRIGILQRGEKQAFYGFMNDRFRSKIERDTPEEVLAVLDGKVAPIRFKSNTQVRRTLRSYVVHVIPTMPACDDRGYSLEIDAYDSKEALSMARKQVVSQYLYDRHDGAKIFTARRK